MTKFEWVLAGATVLILLGAGEAMLREPKHYIKIDCQVAEISPDIAKEVKELCRKLRK